MLIALCLASLVCLIGFWYMSDKEYMEHYEYVAHHTRRYGLGKLIMYNLVRYILLFAGIVLPIILIYQLILKKNK